MAHDHSRPGRSAGPLPPGVVALLTEIRTALDLPVGDGRIMGRAASVTGVVKTALSDAASDADCKLLAGVLRDATRVTS